METRHTPIQTPLQNPIQSPVREAAISSQGQAAVNAPLGRIDRAMANALRGLDIEPSGPLADPGAVEYASWMRLLRRAAP